MYKKITEAQYIKDMKTVGVPEKDFEWHLELFRKTEKLRCAEHYIIRCCRC